VVNKPDLEILTDLSVLSFLAFYIPSASLSGKLLLVLASTIILSFGPCGTNRPYFILSLCLSVCMYVWVDGWTDVPSLAPERLGGFYSNSVFKNSSLMGPCLLNMNIPNSKVEAFKTDHQNIKWQLSLKRL
jgi:hypothetical protein